MTKQKSDAQTPIPEKENVISKFQPNRKHSEYTPLFISKPMRAKLEKFNAPKSVVIRLMIKFAFENGFKIKDYQKKMDEDI
jgi:hypothetical protein